MPDRAATSCTTQPRQPVAQPTTRGACCKHAQEKPAGHPGLPTGWCSTTHVLSTRSFWLPAKLSQADRTLMVDPAIPPPEARTASYNTRRLVHVLALQEC